MLLSRITLVVILLSLISGLANVGNCAESIPFDDNWKFTTGESEDAIWRLSPELLDVAFLETGNDLVKLGEKVYFRGRPRPNRGIERIRPNFDDSTWQNVTLPHDYAILGKFDKNNDPRDTYLPCTVVGWYRKTFTVPKAAEDSRFYLDFDGVMSHAAVWVNSQLVGGWAYGYTSFRLDITPFLNKDRTKSNVVVVRTARPPKISRWYTGAGIYRHVRLTVARPVHFAHWGIFVATPACSKEKAIVQVQTEVQNEYQAPVDLKIKTAIYRRAPDGTMLNDPVVKGQTFDFNLKGKGEIKTSTLPPITITKPQLWQLDDPAMYVLCAELYKGSELVDREYVPFGIRSIQYDPNKGFFLNGKKIFIKGVCLHHDLGSLGAAVYPRAIERQLELLKESGCNAIRLSHNPASPEQMDLLDRMGFLVQAEAFDEWKRPHIYSIIRPYCDMFDRWHERDLRALIRRDRNHPSIVMYSVGNEIPELAFPSEFVAIAERLQKIVKQEDTTRPTTSGNNYAPAGVNECARVLDIFGYNYFGRKMYSEFHKKNPDKFVYGSEVGSMGTTRGEYFFPATGKSWDCMHNFHQSSYCTFAINFDPEKPLNNWAAPPDYEFKAMDMNPFVGGCFFWSGFDYLGAPGSNDAIGDFGKLTDPELIERSQNEKARTGITFVPVRICESGMFDTAGFRKDLFYMYQSYWRPNLPMAYLLPHWNWEGRQGEVTPVHLFTTGDEAELFLNGKSLGTRKKGKFEYRMIWKDVRWEPGELRAVVSKNGKKWCETSVKTTGKTTALRLTADRSEIAADGRDLSFITIETIDQNGDFVPTEEITAKIFVTGPGKCIATDNGDCIDWTPYPSLERKTFNGKLLAIVKSNSKQKGELKISAASDRLKSNELTVKLK